MLLPEPLHPHNSVPLSSFYKPVINSIYGRLEGINIQVLVEK